MKKHVVIIQNTEIGGHGALSTFLTGLLRHYTKDDILSYDLICGALDKIEEAGHIAQIMTIHGIGTSYNTIKDNLCFVYKSFLKLLEIKKKGPIDIIHCLYPNSSLQAAVLYKICIDRKVKIIYDVRSPWIEMSFANNWISQKKQRIKKLMHLSERLLIKWVDYVVFITDGTKKYYEETYARSFHHVSIIPTGVDIAQFAQPISNETKQTLKKKLSLKQEDIIIGYVGTISRMRQMSQFLRTQIAFITKFPVVFVMIGDGDDASQIQQLFDQHGISEKLLMLGSMPQSQLIPYMHLFDYGRCHLPDIFVFRHSFPLKILEYLAVGLPVLSSNIFVDTQLHHLFADHLFFYDQAFPEELMTKNTLPLPPKKSLSLFGWESLYMQYKEIYCSLSR